MAKDEHKDRQILHRKRRNRRERHLVGASRELPHGVLLCQLPLEDRFICVRSVDDVKDFYHAYSVTEARARSSPVGKPWRVPELAHLHSCQEALAAGRISPDDKVVCCFKGLGMGDHAAVDIAQQSHVNLLRAFGAMQPTETLSYRSKMPHPETNFYEGVMIDDHLGVQLLEKDGPISEILQRPARDQSVFAQSAEAYDNAGLEAHEKKRVRRATVAKVWGTEVEGVAGLVGPVRSRLVRLMQLTFELLNPGVVDEKILEATLGLWAYCAQFRRPMFSFLYELYRQTSPDHPRCPFKLTAGARNELLILTCLAPLCITDLKALPEEALFCVDASPSGAGACRAQIPRDLSRELWRRSDKLGYRAPLLSRLEAGLRGVA